MVSMIEEGILDEDEENERTDGEFRMCTEIILE